MVLSATWHRIGRWWWRRQARLTPILLIAPAATLFLLFVIYPIGRSVWLSFHSWDGIGPRTWVGLANYRELAEAHAFHTALVNSAMWLIGYMAAPVMGLLLALLVNQRIRGLAFVRTLFFMPFVVSPVVVGIMFAWLFNSEFGLFTKALTTLGLPPAVPLNGQWAIVVVILAGLWPQTAYCMLLYLAALNNLDGDQIESARLDGARGLGLFRGIVFPQLYEANFIVTLVCIVSALRAFDLVVVITGGGPFDSSTVLGHYMYEQTFRLFRFGYGAAIATVLLLLMLLYVSPFLVRIGRANGR